MDLPTSQAEFTLNFQPHGDGGGDGGRSGDGGSRGSRGQDWEFADEDMVQEMVFENGQEYYHVIIKDEYQDFSMDFYIKTASGNGYYDDRSTGPASSSYGSGGDNLRNYEDPFTFESGNGSGNPNRMYMRMIINDGGFEQEFLKAKLDKKPIITQTVVDTGFHDDVVIDMSNSNYDQINVAGSVDIHTVITDAAFPGGESDFLLSRDGGQVDVSAGKFTYTPSSEIGGSLGQYDYTDSDFDVYSVDWLEFCEPSQNPQHDCNFDSSSRGSRGGRGGGWDGGGSR